MVCAIIYKDLRECFLRHSLILLIMNWERSPVSTKGNKKMAKKILKSIMWVAIIAFLAVTAIFGWGTNKDGSMSTIKLGLDLAGGVSITYQAVGEASSQEMSDAAYILQKRAEEYTPDAEVYQEGSDRISIEIPGVTDANKVLEEMGKPGELYFISQYGADGTANYTQALVGTGDGGYEYTYVLSKSIETLEADGSIVLTGADVDSAQAGSQMSTTGMTEYVVELVLTKEGTAKFAEATAAAAIAKESIGIYYDGEIVSAPIVNDKITDGNAVISGMESFEEASNLATTIRIGALPVKLEEIRSNVVGAKLGEDAIETSLLAGAIGIILVFIFMIVTYRIPGLVASIALAIYTMLTLIVINVAKLTLTLPGIAGIILSIGMAVDANVIIFERIKEELATGKTVRSSIKIGFSKALSAIIDGNITTLIASVVLAFMGSGAVKGFAYTLAIGIILSMFTALIITRLILNLFYELGAKDEKLYGVAKTGKAFDFIGKKNICFVVSLGIIILGFVFMGINGASGKGMLNYSLEFKGGTSTTVTFNEEYTQAQIESDIIPVISSAIGDTTVQQQKVQGTTEVVFKTNNLTLEQRTAMEEALISGFGITNEKIVTENISASVSDEMKKDAIMAVVIATVCMLLYIWFRFKDVRFAASSVIALLHDVLVVLAFYALARVSVGNTFIACMLTIVGYSINATIVIFDRVRENLAAMDKRDTLENVVNTSISQTLKRSIYTSLTTFVMVVVLFILGVTSIKEFAAPLMVGIVCGGYSSVFLAGAFWYVFKKHFVSRANED